MDPCRKLVSISPVVAFLGLVRGFFRDDERPKRLPPSLLSNTPCSLTSVTLEGSVSRRDELGRGARMVSIDDLIISIPSSSFWSCPFKGGIELAGVVQVDVEA